MQIHELNNFSGTLGSGAYLAIDDGTDTGKISSQGLLAATEARIDNIIAGPAPSAEEIVDARLGADGVTYPSLGDAIRDQFTDVKSDINENNASNVLCYLKKTDGSGSGVTYSWSGDSCTVTSNGASTGTSFNNIFSSPSSFPAGIKAGGTYIMNCGGTNVNLAVYAYVNGSLSQIAIEPTTKIITIPANASGLIIRLLVWGQVTVNETVTPIILTALTNKMLESNINVLESKTIINNGALGSGVISSCDDINKTCIYFVTSSGGTLAIPDFPLGQAGWLETIITNGNIAMQIAYPYTDHGDTKYRSKNLGVWNSWRTVAGGTTTITQEVSRDTYNNTYNITTSPTITTDTNGWLQPVDTNTSSEVGKTDMTGAIMSMLTDTGYCHLAEGIYYVSGGIDMPAGSMIEGCGKNTIIRLLQSTTSGYIVRMHTKSTLKNVCLSGGYEAGDISIGDIGGRKGVNYIGNRDGQTPSVTPSTCTFCIIDGCFFENLDSGIYGYNAGGGLQEGLVCSNSFFTQCKAGINLDYWTEYSKFTNCVMFQCYYACINNGGNNVFTACTFHGVIGFLLDNSGNNKNNNGHGSVIGCTFNHINNMNIPSQLGKGLGIKVLNTSNGFIFANCQLWYGRIHIENSKGVQITGCELGGLGDSSYPIIECSGDNPLFIDNCLFNGTPYFSISSPAKFSNCWTYSGTAVTG